MPKVICMMTAETGGIEEASAFNGSHWSASQDQAATGSWSYKSIVASTFGYLYLGNITFPSLKTNESCIFSFKFRYTGTPNANAADTWFSSGATPGAACAIVTDGSANVRLRAQAGTSITATGTTILSADTWYRIEVYWYPATGSSGYVRVYLDDVLECSALNTNTVSTGTPRMYSSLSTQVGVVFYMDDIVTQRFCTSEDDRLGDWKIYAFQNAKASATPDWSLASGTLDSGNWDDAGESPWSDTNVISYTNTPRSGGVWCADPAGLSLSGGEFIGRYNLFRALRGNGGGTVHSFYMGNDESTDQYVHAEADLTTGYTEYGYFQTQFPDSFRHYTTGSGAYHQCVCWNPDDEQLVLGTATLIYYSNDYGETWSTGNSLGSGGFVWGIAWSPSLGLYVAARAQTSDQLFYSSNGSTWTAVTTSTFGSSLVYGVCWNPTDGLFVAVGADGKIAYSSNGTTWTQASSTTFGTSTIRDVIWNDTNSVFVAVGADGKIAYSADGDTWTAASTNGFTGTETIYAIAENTTNGILCAVSGSSGEVGSSSDGGDTWTMSTDSTVDIAETIYGVGYDPWSNCFIAHYATNTAYSWNDGLVWETTSPVPVEPSNKLTYNGVSMYPRKEYICCGYDYVYKSNDTFLSPLTVKAMHGFGVDGAKDISVSEIFSSGLWQAPGTQTLEAALSLGIDLDDAYVPSQSFDGALTLTYNLGVTFSPIQILQGLVTLTHNLGVTNSADAVMIAAATLGITLNQAQAADAIMLASVALSHSLDTSIVGGKVFDEAVALAIILTEAAAGNLITNQSIQLDLGLRCVKLGPELMTDPGFDAPGEWTTFGAIAVTGSQLVADNVESTRFAQHAAPGATVGRTYRISVDANQSWTGTNWNYRVQAVGKNINIGYANQADFEQLRWGMYLVCSSAVALSVISHIGGSGYTVYGTSDNFSIKHAYIEANAVADRSLSLGINLTQSQINNSVVQALLALGITLQQIQEGTVPAAIIEAALSLGIDLTQAQAANANTFASYTDNINLDQTQSSQVNAEASYTDNINLDQTQSSDASMQASVTLEHQLSQSQSAQAVMYAVLALVNNLNQTQIGEISAQTVEAALSLGINLAQTSTATADKIAQTALAISLAQAQSNIATAEASITLDNHLSQNQSSDAVAEASITFGSSLGITSTAQQIATATISLAIDLGLTNDADISIEAAVTYALSLAQTTTATAAAIAQLSLAHTLAQTLAADASMEAAIDIGILLSDSEYAAAIIDAVLSLAIDLGVTFDADISIEAAVTYALSLAQTSSASANQIAQLALGHILAESQSASANAFANVTLSHTLDDAEIGQKITDAVITLAVYLAQTQTATITTNVFEASVSLGIQLFQTQSATIGAAASLALNIVMAETASATADMQAAVTFAAGLGITSQATANMLADISLGISQGYTAAPNKVTDAVLTFAHQLSQTVEVSGKVVEAALLLAHQLASYTDRTADVSAALALINSLGADFVADANMFANTSFGLVLNDTYFSGDLLNIEGNTVFATIDDEPNSIEIDDEYNRIDILDASARTEINDVALIAYI